MYGLYDTKDDCWFGDENGPRKFADLMLARCAAQMTEAMLKWDVLDARIQVREIPEYAFRLKDEVLVKRTALRALKHIEGIQ